MTATIREALLRTRRALAAAGVEEAPLEADLLAARALGGDRAQIYSRLSEHMPDDGEAALEALLGRRLRREPLAYLLGEREFYDLRFLVVPGVFIPRPETELLVERALNFVEARFPERDARIADVGTGCGAIAVSLAYHLPAARLFAMDISQEALRMAEENARAHGVAGRISFLYGDLLEPLTGPVDLVVANLPYLKSGTIRQLAPEVGQYEPWQALDGGPDGLDVVRRLLRQAPTALRPGGALLLELDPDQMDAASAATLAVFPGARLERLADLAGRSRCLVIDCGVS